MKKIGLKDDEFITGALSFGFAEGELIQKEKKITGNPVSYVE